MFGQSVVITYTDRFSAVAFETLDEDEPMVRPITAFEPSRRSGELEDLGGSGDTVTYEIGTLRCGRVQKSGAAVAPPRRTEVWNVLEFARRNPTMATVERTPAIDPEVLADLEAVCNTKGIVRDPKLLRRITERADQVRRKTLKQFGVPEIGAEIIRTMHDPE